MPRGYRNGFNPNRDSDGQYSIPGRAGRPSANRGTTQVYQSRDKKTTVTKDIRGTFSMKRNGILTGATVTPARGGGYNFTRPNGRTKFTVVKRTQTQAVEALKRHARGD
jgi:hypothetical protein